MYERTCTGCGNLFQSPNFRRTRCMADCGRLTKNQARKIRSDANDLHFIGVDGEGVDRPDGTHEYVMLSVGDQTLWREGKALTLRDTLSFLYERYTEHPAAAFIGFYLGYDFIQWEKLLPEDRARLLLTSEGIAERKTRRASNPNPYPDPVVWEGWEIDIMAGRRFKLRPHTHHLSQFTGNCRNRTCRAELSMVVPEDFSPHTLVSGEDEWSVPEDDGDEFTGSEDAFWSRFGTPKCSVGQKVKSKNYGWMYICDTGPFWQTSFLNVIDPSKWDGKPVCTDDEYQLIVQGKSDRGIVAEYGTTDYFEEMRGYNVLENDILARVTTRLNQGFMNDRIPIKIGRNEWYGPGRAAQLWMDQLHSRCADPSIVEYNKYVTRNNGSSENQRLERKNEGGILNLDCYDSVPAWFRSAAQSSYYGGWFEQFVHGHCGDVWEYDINSAYPFVIASLPCLHVHGIHNGQYSQGDGDRYPIDGRRLSLLYADVRGSNPYIGAMPHRDRHGRISRPNRVKGWYWHHELEAAKRTGLIDSVRVEGWVSYLPCDCGTPFNPADIGIEALYQLRLDFGKNSPQGKSAKNGYNSAYGKTAQSIGQPKYSNPIYASLITAGCRTLILDAIGTHPKGASAVTMVATDGVYFLSPHPGLNLSKTELGAWDETHKRNMTQLMPGVYWDESTREAVGLGIVPKLKSRGVNAKDLASQISSLDVSFAHAQQALSRGETFHWPTIRFHVGFLLTSAKSALHRGKWNNAGRVDHGTERSISAEPTSKRMLHPYRDDTANGIVRSRPYYQHADLESVPYDKSFGYVEDTLDGLFEGRVGRDGQDPLAYWRELING